MLLVDEGSQTVPETSTNSARYSGGVRQLVTWSLIESHSITNRHLNKESIPMKIC